MRCAFVEAATAHFRFFADPRARCLLRQFEWTSKWFPRIQWVALLSARYEQLADKKDATLSRQRSSSHTSDSMSGLQPPSLGELQHAAKEYLDEHEADTAQQDERYRARIFKELSKATHERSEVHRQLEAVRTELKAQASEEKKRTEQLELAFKTEFEMVQTVLKELKDLKYMSFVSAQTRRLKRPKLCNTYMTKARALVKRWRAS
jgi:hypothetical protein